MVHFYKVHTLQMKLQVYAYAHFINVKLGGFVFDFEKNTLISTTAHRKLLKPAACFPLVTLISNVYIIMWEIKNIS